jgi:toxin YhaV
LNGCASGTRTDTARRLRRSSSKPFGRQGRTVGDACKHWRRDKFFQRFRLFFRYSSDPAIIAYAWLNDEGTLRKRGARTDPYVVFRAMLERGRPPDDWNALVRACLAWTDADVEGRLRPDNATAVLRALRASA